MIVLSPSTFNIYMYGSFSQVLFARELSDFLTSAFNSSRTNLYCLNTISVRSCFPEQGFRRFQVIETQELVRFAAET